MGKLPERFELDKVAEFKDLKTLLKNSAKKHINRSYFTYRTKGNKDVCHISFKELDEIVDKLGTAFFKMGVMGKNIALLAETRYEWIASYLATTNGNGVIIPLDKEIAPEQIINFMERADTSCVVYSGAFASLMESYAKNQGAGGKIKLFVNLDLSLDVSEEQLKEFKELNIYSFSEILEIGMKALEENCRDFVDTVIDNQKMCACLFTSGTTGTSKAVMLSHKNICASSYHAACDVDFSKDDVVVAVLPAHHTYETSCTFLATLSLGVEVCVNESLKTVLRSFQFYKPTRLVLVPLFVDTMAKKIWDEIEKKGKTKTVKNAIKLSNALRKIGIDLRRKMFKEVLDAFGGRLEGIICGGAPLNSEHITTFDNFGIKLWQGYGITECSPLISVVPSDMHMKKIGSAGFPIFANTVRIDENTRDNNGYGELLVKGDNVMLGYLNDEEATCAVMTDDGYFRTGDIGYIDRDGYIYITGRKKNVIILSNGKNIYPEELEEYLYKIAAVKECVVVARDVSNSGDNIVLTAIIYPDFDKFTEKNLTEVETEIKKSVTHMNKQLPTFKHINNVELRETEFEKTTSKKIIRYKIK